MPGRWKAACRSDGGIDEHVGPGGWTVLVDRYGYIVAGFHSYDAPFVPMAALLLVGTVLWFKIDASEEISPEPANVVVAGAPVEGLGSV